RGRAGPARSGAAAAVPGLRRRPPEAGCRLLRGAAALGRDDGGVPDGPFVRPDAGRWQLATGLPRRRRARDRPRARRAAGDRQRGADAARRGRYGGPARPLGRGAAGAAAAGRRLRQAELVVPRLLRWSGRGSFGLGRVTRRSTGAAVRATVCGCTYRG